MNKIKGTGVALVTPFNEDKSVDYKGLENLLNHVIDGGIDYLVLMGTTGESVTLSKGEKVAVVDFCKKINNSRVPVVLGIGGNNTMQVVEDIKSANLDGIDAILSVSPAYNKPSQEGLYQHYKAIASSVEIPFVLYNVPGRTGVDLNADTAIRLFDDIPNIYAIKEATGSLERAIEIHSKREGFHVISGDDAIDFPMLTNGATGIISVTANLLPDLKSELVHCVQNGDLKRAREINEFLYPLNKVLFCESNPIPIKAAMYLSGLLDTLEYRLPLTAPSAETMKKLEQVLTKYKVIK